MCHVSTDDVNMIVEAAREFRIEPRADRWCHLSLCVIDAVFSIGARYGSTWRTARRYADHAQLVPITAPAASVAAGEYDSTEQTLSSFCATTSSLSEEAFADILGNRQRTSTRGGILKGQAVRQYVDVLAKHQVEKLADVPELLDDFDSVKVVESDLARIRGHGSGIRVSYLWMLAGDDHHVKADRMVIRWSSRVLGRALQPVEASRLIVNAAESLGATPWELDHAIWRQQSGRVASTSTST